jgi:hypothetical protein
VSRKQGVNKIEEVDGWTRREAVLLDSKADFVRQTLEQVERGYSRSLVAV